MSTLLRTNSVLVLVDFQPRMFRGVHSGDTKIIMNAVEAVVKSARLMKIPIVVTTIGEKVNGAIVHELASVLDAQTEVIERKVPGFDALEDEAVRHAIEKTKCKNVVIAGLWTSMCFTFSALHAVKLGYNVYGLMDAGGDDTLLAHECAIKRMVHANVVPMTWMPVVSSWMHDWADKYAEKMSRDVFSVYSFNP
jgi:nicotinamidase-related amidase